MERIVIIGGGSGGINCAQTLASILSESDNIQVVLFEKHQFYYHTPGVPRAFVEETFVNKLFVPYENAIPKVGRGFTRIIRAVVIAIQSDTREIVYQLIQDDDIISEEIMKLSFNYLVIATGSSQLAPIKPDPVNYARPIVENQFHILQTEIEKAENILVLGGGPVGVEVAAEIANKYPNKQVTIVDARNELIAGNKLTSKFRTNLSNGLQKLGIRVILGERVTERFTGNNFKKKTVVTDKGTNIESDIQLLCLGFQPQSDLVRQMDENLVTEKGFVKVKDNLELVGEVYQNIFALGDVCDHDTPKLQYWAGEQAKFLAKEIVQVVRKKQQYVKDYPKVTTEVMLITLGHHGGVGQIPYLGGQVIGNTAMWWLKSSDMAAGKYWGELGATVPK